MQITDTFYPENRQAWHDWLVENHRTRAEIWLIHYKKATGRPTVRYDDSLDEALCFGWIDGIRQRLDEERFVQRYSPRAEKTHWSLPNLTRVKRLLAEGRMQPFGLEKLGDRIHHLDQPDVAPASEFVPPEWMLAELRANPTAYEYFKALRPSVSRSYLRWVASAKRDETARNRMREVIDKLSRNEPLGMK